MHCVYELGRLIEFRSWKDYEIRINVTSSLYQTDWNHEQFVKVIEKIKVIWVLTIESDKALCFNKLKQKHWEEPNIIK